VCVRLRIGGGRKTGRVVFTGNILSVSTERGTSVQRFAPQSSAATFGSTFCRYVGLIPAGLGDPRRELGIVATGSARNRCDGHLGPTGGRTIHAVLLNDERRRGRGYCEGSLAVKRSPTGTAAPGAETPGHSSAGGRRPLHGRCPT